MTPFSTSLTLILLFLILQVHGFNTNTNTDAVILLSFKFSIVSDPLQVLQTWNYNTNQTPCSWNGVQCSGPGKDRVTSITLSNSQLQGSIPADLGLIQNLQFLDLSNNSLNGSIPFSLFNATNLRFLDLSSNSFSGQLPENMFALQNLQVLNLSDNALAGKLPDSVTNLKNLTTISAKNNYLSNSLPSGFVFVQSLDLSSNLIDGSLPSDFGGDFVRYLNLSYNRISGEIPTRFGENIPGDAKIDLSFNNLQGQIPDSTVFVSQDSKSFAGNSDLCGEEVENPCFIASSPTSPPAFAAIPRNSSTDATSYRAVVRIVGIVIGDIVGVVILGFLGFYVYKWIKSKKVESIVKDSQSYASSSSSESKGFNRWSCLRQRAAANEESESTEYETDDDEKQSQRKSQENQLESKGVLVTVDGEKQLEIETLLKASAYILGASGSSIVYKAVLDDGTTLAVRRIGESNVDRFRNFESQVRVIAKLIHPNLVRTRGFYWGVHEKLIIYDFVPNGSLANARYSKFLLINLIIIYMRMIEKCEMFLLKCACN